MKHILTIAALMLGTTAAADGPTPGTYDPPLIPPATSNWTGFYAGASVNVTREESERTREEAVTETCEREDDNPTAHYYNKCVVPDEYTEDLPRLTWKQCDNSDYDACRIGNDLVWLNGEPLEYVTGYQSITEAFTDSQTGGSVFVGYGTEVGSMILRTELDVNQDYLIAEMQAGYDLSVLLPYVSTGIAYDGDSTAQTIGGGIDYAVTSSMFTGISYDRIDDWDQDVIGLRVGFNF